MARVVPRETKSDARVTRLRGVKTCPRCLLRPTEPGRGYCNPCHAERMREWRADHPARLWAWMVFEADEWNIIGAVGPWSGLRPLVTSREHVADAMRLIAEAHAERTGLPVRLVHFTEAGA